MLLLLPLIPEPNKSPCHLQRLSCRITATRKAILRALKLLMLGLFLQGDLLDIHVLASSIPEFIHVFLFSCYPADESKMLSSNSRILTIIIFIVLQKLSILCSLILGAFNQECIFHLFLLNVYSLPLVQVASSMALKI